MQPPEERQPVPARMAPPSDTAALYLAPHSPAWPKTIGVIAIVFGALATLGGAVGLIGQIFAEQFAAMVPAQQREAMNATLALRPWIMVEQAVRCALGILLIVGGARLAGRSPAGVRLCRRWALLKILVALGSGALAVGTIDQQLAAMPSASTGPAPFSPAMMRALVQFGIGLALVWATALPVFMLVWLGRRSVQLEVQSWQHVDTVS